MGWLLMKSGEIIWKEWKETAFKIPPKKGGFNVMSK